MTIQTDAASSLANKAKTRIFISYSRGDMAFVDRLEASLKEWGFEPLIDRAEIVAFEDWWKRIEQLIAQADTVIFVLSPRSIASAVCQKEVAFASSLNKRFAPVVCTAVDNAAVPAALARLNFVFLNDETSFAQNMGRLVDALETDIEWIRRHTEFGQSALRWDFAGRPGPSGLMLRSPMLDEAEMWLKFHPRGAPEPTDATRAFIAASRAAQDAETAAKEEQMRRLRRSTGLSFVEPVRQALNEAQPAKALCYALVGCLLADDPDFELVPELYPPARAAAYRSRLRAVLGHAGSVNDAAFSPDSRRILTTANHEKTLRLWDSASFAQIASLDGDWGNKDGEAARSSFSPDGSQIITRSYVDKRVFVWSADNGQLLATLRSNFGPVRAFFTSDPKRIIICSHGETELWDAASGQSIASFKGQAIGRKCFDFGAGRIVTESSSDGADLWDLSTGVRVALLDHLFPYLKAAEFSSDGKRLVTITKEDREARLWDAKTGLRIAILGHKYDALDASFSPDGPRLLTVAWDGARLWDAESGRLIATMMDHDRSVTSASFSPDGSMVVTASQDGTAMVWWAEDGDGYSPGSCFNILGHHLGSVVAASFSADGGRLVTAAGPQVHLWNNLSRVPADVLGGHDGDVWSAVFSPDGRWLLSMALNDRTVQVWDAAWNEIATLRGHAAEVDSASFTRDGRRIVTTSVDKTARLWDAASGSQIAILSDDDEDLKHHKGQSIERSEATSPDGCLKVVGSLGDPDDLLYYDARVSDAASGAQIGTLRGHPHPITSLMFDSEGKRVVTASRDRTARVWDVHRASALFVTPRLAALVASLSNGVGVIPDRDKKIELMREAPSDLYAEVLRRYPALASAIKQAEDALAND